MVVGILRVDLHIPEAQSLKQRRSVLNQLKAHLHKRHNVSASQLEAEEKWQRATLGISTIADHQDGAQRVLNQTLATLRAFALIVVIAVEQEYL